MWKLRDRYFEAARLLGKAKRLQKVLRKFPSLPSVHLSDAEKHLIESSMRALAVDWFYWAPPGEEKDLSEAQREHLYEQKIRVECTIKGIIGQEHFLITEPLFNMAELKEAVDYLVECLVKGVRFDESVRNVPCC